MKEPSSTAPRVLRPIAAVAGFVAGIAVAVLAARRNPWRGPVVLGGFALVSGALLLIERLTR